MAVIVVAPIVAVFIVASLQWLPLLWWSPLSSLTACGCYGHPGLTLAPVVATVAEVSMWGSSLGCGKVMVGVGTRAAV